LAENLSAMASRLDDLLDPEFRFKPRIAGRRGRGDAHRVTSLRAALSGLGRSKPYDVGRARENSRRCVVKCHYVSMHGGGRDAARLHLAYLERDGVERDGSPGQLYGADASFDKAGFAEPLKGEKRQFRFIVSPEDGRDVDLQAFTRELMAQVEKDLGRSLIWTAVTYLSQPVLMPRSPFEVKEGTIIPTTLLTGINSDLPGQIVGQVRENVYDTVSGAYLLIPQGSRLIAAYDSAVSFGQERVLVCWNRLIRPDGVSISLECMPGVDLAGSSGFSDEVNHHWWRIVIRIAKTRTMAKKTKPPKRFTAAGLVQAMTGIARYVSNPQIKALLRETDGIGTPATQASIIQTLFERHFIEEQKRQIVSTGTGRALIRALPAVAMQPDMTARWEASLRKISEGQAPLEGFLDAVRRQLGELVERARRVGAIQLPGIETRPCTAPGCAGVLRVRVGKAGRFWACSCYPDCTHTEHAQSNGGGVRGDAGKGSRGPRRNRNRQRRRELPWADKR
jgi:Bacterial conjugation TrbI-like protein/DNA topoisomerase